MNLKGNCWFSGQFFETGDILNTDFFFKTEKMFPKVSCENAKTTIYKISMHFNSQEMCQKEPDATLSKPWNKTIFGQILKCMIYYGTMHLIYYNY